MSRASVPLAGFQVTLIGRFWVTPEVEAEESIKRVAEWFDVKPASVRAAVTFENQLAA